tara:strand:+ start:24448 stop:24963 length:516 start_codon:yes stop_codon:yes gene_type:complete
MSTNENLICQTTDISEGDTSTFSTHASLTIGDRSSLAMDIVVEPTTAAETYGCTECWELYFAGITDECTCGEEFTGCISSLSITNPLIRVKNIPHESAELTFDYEVSLSEEVSDDSYIMIKMLSDSWTGETHVVLFVPSGNSTSSGSGIVVLTDIVEVESLNSTIQVKFKS